MKKQIATSKLNKMERISTFKDFVGELTVNYSRTKIALTKITSSEKASGFMRSYFKDIIDDHEEVKILHLNKNNGIVNVQHLTSGSDCASIVPIKDILRSAILIKVSGIIMFHNHPSGNLNPSEADIDITKKLKEACSLLEIKLVDSIILTQEGFYSLHDNNKF